MPTLENARHELYCQNRVSGMNQTHAYIEAGYSEHGGRSAACLLSAKPNIKKRIAELHERSLNMAVKKTVLTEAFVIEGLQKIALACSERDTETWNPTAAKAAFDLLGKRLGIWIADDTRRNTKDLTTAKELDAAAKDLRAEIARMEQDRLALVAAQEKAQEDADLDAGPKASANANAAQDAGKAASG